MILFWVGAILGMLIAMLMLAINSMNKKSLEEDDFLSFCDNYCKSSGMNYEIREEYCNGCPLRKKFEE